eukprot:PhM_4_TR17012/c0_g1_i1/m.96667
MNAHEIEQILTRTPTLLGVRKAVRDETMRPAYSVEAVRSGECVSVAIDNSGGTVRLANHVVALHSSSLSSNTYSTSNSTTSTSENEPLMPQWKKRVSENLMNASAALGGIPFVRILSASSSSSSSSTFPMTMNGTSSPPSARVAANAVAWTAPQLFSVIVGGSTTSMVLNRTPRHFLSRVSVILPTWSREELQHFFSDLHPKYRQTGVGADEDRTGFMQERRRLCDVLLRRGYVPLVSTFLRRGCPAENRKRVWQTVLGCEPRMRDQRYYDQLRTDVTRVQLLVDELIKIDVFNTINDDRFFVFDEAITHTALCLLHDTFCASVAERFLPQIHCNNNIRVSPSGLYPCQGFTMIIAALCFFVSDPSELYFLFRTLYCRHFIKLHSVLASEECLPSLLRLFESLLSFHAPEVVDHCNSTLGVSPIAVATAWLHTAFVGFLEVEQVLYLWDCIVAFDSVVVMPIAAAAIFVWRREEVLQCTTETQLQSVFSDFSKIEIISLIQLVLFLE